MYALVVNNSVTRVFPGPTGFEHNGNQYAPDIFYKWSKACLLYTSPSPRDQRGSRMPSSA